MLKETSKILAKQLTQDEKLRLISGFDYWHTRPVERLGIPGVMMSDGPHGLRKQSSGENAMGLGGSERAVAFPTAAGTAASFDRALLQALGETLGGECRSENLAMLLGPAVNIKRSPLCGRNFEYFSEDPYLAGELAVSYTQGLQSRGVGVSIKHFAANNQEKRRMTVRSVVDERALREIYLPAFEQTVRRADPWTVMCAYNRLFEGIYCSENKRLLTDILRREWGFQGAVVSDWGAVSNRAAGVAAGLDLEMPASHAFHQSKLRAALESGELTEEALTTACERVIYLALRAVAAQEAIPAPATDWEADHEKSRVFARQSMVLLKNSGALPLKAEQRIAFIGGFAKTPRYQGGGSSHTNPWRVVSALEAAKTRGLAVEYTEGFGAKDYEYNPVMLRRAVELAANSDTVVIFAGLPDSMETEGADRRHLDLPPCQNLAIKEICAVNPNVTVVLHNGSPVRMPWVEDVNAILESYLAGEAIGDAQLDLLCGDYSPCAKLAETFPLALQDTPCYGNFPGAPLTVEYRESIFVGYRYYETAAKPVLFPFGHGLTYTTFAYDDLVLSDDIIAPTDTITASVTITNTGNFDAAEIVQCYVGKPNTAVFRAAKELKGFAKVFLKAGQSERVTFTLNPRAFAYYHTGLKDWYCENGTYLVMIAASSADIRLQTELELVNDTVVPQLYQSDLPNYSNANVHAIPDAEFAQVLGFPIPKAKNDTPQRKNLDSTLEESADSALGRLILWILPKAMPIVKKIMSDLGEMDQIVEMVTEMPIRTIAFWSSGMMDLKMTEAIVSLFNDEKQLRAVGTFLAGAARGIRGLFKKQ
ncbi:MAG: glycoside hydrolase family 3 C-terminal domain-containing protein [Oscillospiraceae bacterium]|jgi:beta-glucosidase|nr:glycoside hydrolase family 3 C-terminal domain-containing protein [Oscillospiraceae bacterium]